MDKKRLQEFCAIRVEILEGEENEKKAQENGFLMMVRGVGMNAGRVTLNKTLYPREIVYREVRNIRPRMDAGRVVGLADHPSMFGGNEVRDSAIRWTSAKINEDNDVVLEGGVLDTEAGNVIAGAYRGGVRYGISSRGYGSVREVEMDEEHPEWELNKDRKGEVVLEIQDDYELESWDMVLKPSNEDAWTESEIKQALARLEAATNTHQEETMDIKDLKTLRESVSAEVVDKIVAEMTEGMVKAEDADKAKADAVTEALADNEKVCEALGISPKLAAYAKDNSDKLEPCAEANYPLDALDPTKVDEEKTELEKQVEAQTKQITALTEKVAEMTDKATSAEKTLRDRERAEALSGIVEAQTVGGRWAEKLAECANDDLELPEDYDGSDAANQAAEKMVETYLGDKRAEFEGIAGAVEPKPGKGTNEGGGEKPEADMVKAAREDFAKDYPALVPNKYNYENAKGAAARAGYGAEFMACYGPAAQEILPLDEVD